MLCYCVLICINFLILPDVPDCPIDDTTAAAGCLVRFIIRQLSKASLSKTKGHRLHTSVVDFKCTIVKQKRGNEGNWLHTLVGDIR